jgi:hypothetical protein
LTDIDRILHVVFAFVCKDTTFLYNHRTNGQNLHLIYKLSNASDEYKALAQEWIDNKEDADKTKEIAPKLRKCITESAAAGCPVCKELQTLDYYLVKRSQWIIGGDGGYPSRDTR